MESNKELFRLVFVDTKDDKKKDGEEGKEEEELKVDPKDGLEKFDHLAVE